MKEGGEIQEDRKIYVGGDRVELHIQNISL